MGFLRIPTQPVKRLQGDPRWANASPFASYAPVVVLSLLFLSIIQIILGAIWMSKLDNLNFPLILQPLVVPCLSFFNTVPSAQLHLYSRANSPMTALVLSTILCLLYLVSALLNLAVCSPSTASIPSLCAAGTVHKKNAPPGTKDESGPKISSAYWDATVALWLLSAVGYGIAVAMAGTVRVRIKGRERDGRRQGKSRQIVAAEVELEGMTPEEVERRNAKAREKWRRIQAG